MMLSYSDIMEHTKQGQLLSKEVRRNDISGVQDSTAKRFNYYRAPKSFRALINELQTEVEVLQQQMLQAMHLRCSKALCSGACECRSGTWRGRAHPLHGSTQPEMERAEQSASEQHYLRMLMDAVRASHVNTDCEAPLDFLCPLTHQLMQDPVLLHETGHSYERKALEEWWASGHHFCPRTGLHLRRLNTSPNHNLRSAIERWQLCSDMHLSFKPVLNTLISQHQQQLNHEKATLCFPQKARFIHRVQTPTQDGSQQNISFIKGHEQDANPRRTPFPGSLGNSPFDLCGDGATMQHEQQPPQIGRAAPVAGALALVSAAPVEHSCRSTDGWNLCKGCAKGVRYIESEAVCEGTGECSLYANPPQHRSSQDPGLIGDASGSGDGMATAASAGMVVERLKSCGAADTVMRQLSGP
ncbi:hypothetical protein Vretimale_5331 [Volvox reticuliferus]|uniref:U-box domain-containing protein n=1 Tax=Volvox reticuliferus TaxID=1737510 RepID=A0A8J4DF92_9CHLO|nr:hypothetical protein Vretimale_5331 [Volvox reticuliferus]